MTKLSNHLTQAPQREQARSEQVQNNAGGYVFAIDKWSQLRRFLIIGTTGGTYYVNEGKLTRENAAIVTACLDEDGQRAVNEIVRVSDEGLAPKNDQAILALALAASHKNDATRKLALSVLPKVCRIGTHLFSFVNDVTQCRRWGRGLRTAVASWYTDRKDDQLAYQLVKYQQRDGWSNRDLLRLSHAYPKSDRQSNMFKWVVGKEVDVGLLPSYIVGFEALKKATTEKEVVSIITQYRMPREAIPTQWLNSPAVWEAMLPDMGLTALIRNLGKMTSIGLVKPLSNAMKIVTEKLENEDLIHKQRLHPMTTLVALHQYKQGHGDKGSLRWTPVPNVIEGLDSCFYKGFKYVEPTGKNIVIAIDVSGSMASPSPVGLSCRDVAAALAMVTVKTEKNYHVVAFTSSGNGYGGRWGGGESGLTVMPLTSKYSMENVLTEVGKLRMGGTDCALPMLYAMKNKLDVDCFEVITDNETWHGSVHPFQALKNYRREMNKPDAKLIVSAVTPTRFSIADPNDPGMLDIAGFSTDVPAVMSEFIKGRI